MALGNNDEVTKEAGDCLKLDWLTDRQCKHTKGIDVDPRAASHVYQPL